HSASPPTLSVRLVVIRGAAEEFLPGAFLMGSRGAGTAVKAAFVEIDQPDLAGRADDEVGEIRVAQADAKIEQAFPHFVDLLPQSISDRGRLLGVFRDPCAESTSFYIGIHQVRIEPERSPSPFNAGNGARSRRSYCSAHKHRCYSWDRSSLPRMRSTI